MLFSDLNPFDEEDVVFYPNGDVSERALEALLHEAHKKGYSDDKRMRCWERVRVSNPGAEIPDYGRRIVKVALGRLKELYGRPYDPEQVSSDHFVPVFIDGELYDIGS